MSWRITKPELTLFATYAICTAKVVKGSAKCEVRFAG